MSTILSRIVPSLLLAHQVCHTLKAIQTTTSNKITIEEATRKVNESREVLGYHGTGQRSIDVLKDPGRPFYVSSANTALQYAEGFVQIVSAPHGTTKTLSVAHANIQFYPDGTIYEGRLSVPNPDIVQTGSFQDLRNPKLKASLILYPVPVTPLPEGAYLYRLIRALKSCIPI